MVSTFLGILLLLMSQSIPEPQGYVNDFADILSDRQEKQLESRLSVYEDSTQIEIAVVTDPDLEGRDVFDVGLEYARNWGVGKSGSDNGLLILIAPNDRRYNIQVGYGLEYLLTDAEVDRWSRNNFPDYFRDSKYYAGIDAFLDKAVNELGTMTQADREAMIEKRKVAEQRQKERRSEILFNILLGILFFGLLSASGVFFYVKIRERKRLVDSVQDEANKIDEKASWLMDRIEIETSPSQSNFSNEFYEFGAFREYKDKLENEKAFIENILEQKDGLIDDRKLKELKFLMDKLERSENEINEIEEFYHDIDSNIKRAKRLIERDFSPLYDSAIATYNSNVSRNKKISSSVFTTLDKESLSPDNYVETIKNYYDHLIELQGQLSKRFDDQKYHHWSNHIKSIEATRQKIKEAEQFFERVYERVNKADAKIERSKDKVHKAIANVDDLIENSDVAVPAFTKAESIKKKANEFSVETFENVIMALNWIRDLSYEAERIASQIEREQAKKRQEIRRSSYTDRSSSYAGSSFGSSSSYGGGGSSFGGFGGGSFGGGGASGGW